MMIKLILTLIVGLTGGLTALKLKVPAGAMVGAMLCTAFFNVITGHAYLPQNVKIITQIAAGAFIGAGITSKDVKGLRHMIKPAILMVSSMIILDLFMGYIMFKMTDIDLVTSLFACAPGGIVDMSLISADLGADASKVALLQMVRIMSVFILFPTMMKTIAKKVSGKKEMSEELKTAEAIASTSEVSDKEKERFSSKKDRAVNLGLTCILAIATGLIGYTLKIPAGTMTFTMFTIGALNIFTGRGYMPLNIRRLTQVFAGILIGERMTYADVIALKAVILPAIILLIGLIIVNLCIGIFISKISDLEIVTSLLASAPGGVSDMALIAKDLGGDAPKVAVLQLARYICIIAFFPVIIKFLC